MFLLLLSCTTTVAPTRMEPSFLKLELAEGSSVGTTEAPLAFTSTGVDYSVSVQALDSSGNPYPLNGDLTLKVRPGKLEQDPTIAVVDGKWSGTVRIKDSFGPTRIWAEDRGDEDATTGRVPTYAVGISPVITFALPTLREMSTTTDTETNNLAGEFAVIRVADRHAVVTARDAAGFWITDTDDEPGTYNSLYVYTFGRPDDEIVVGAQLSLLTGNNQEYLATTQLSFPSVEVVPGVTLPVPPPVDISTSCDDKLREGLEGSRVRLPNAVIPADFMSNPDYADKFTNYDEWPAQVGSCLMYIMSSATAPDFDPVAHSGETLGGITGMLKEIYGDPVLVVIDPNDIATSAQGPVH